ncbi:hypothetical protein CSA17_00065 [bacterium DOLJORAL78_65_58]|nr:MAG: hypothetical protein CSA17_00065 [bacterium DOLJORAL78_65_58]
MQGRGWDQNDWPVQEYPTRALLDVVVGTRPVLIRRIDGHAALASSQALALAGITADTPDPDGGQILRDKAGRPTGLLIDNAVDLVLAIIPQPDADEVARRVRLAIDHCHRYGITGVHEAGVSWERVGYYQSLAQAGKLDLRIYAMLDDVPATLDAAFAQGPIFTPDDIFTARAVKIYADGALGSRGARLLADYTDQPGHRGLLVTDPAHLREVSRRARDKGFQVGAHAIGDAANRLLLNIFSELNKEDGSVRDPRWRIEHSQILHPEDIPRFAREGVIAAMQPVHCTSDMDWAEQRLGAGRDPAGRLAAPGKAGWGHGPAALYRRLGLCRVHGRSSRGHPARLLRRPDRPERQPRHLPTRPVAGHGCAPHHRGRPGGLQRGMTAGTNWPFPRSLFSS